MESDLGKLFIGGISWDTDEERLKEYFRNYGEVVEAVIMRDRATGRARGFGFIVFSDPQVAERVIMDKHVIDGRTVEAKKAVPKDDQQHILSRSVIGIQGSPGPARTRKIFVGGLASTVTESDFKTYFDQFGAITDVVVMYDHNTQRPRGFGFITFDSEEAVDMVLHRTFHELNGKMVEVKRAVPKELSSPSPARGSPFSGGLGFGLGRANSFLAGYAPTYNNNNNANNLSPVGGFGARMDERFIASQISSSRAEFSPLFGSAAHYLDQQQQQQGLSPSYSANSVANSNALGYARMLSPYYATNGNRYNTPIGYNVSNGRTNSGLSSSARNAWGNGGPGVQNGPNPGSPGAYLGSGNGNFGVSFGNNNNNNNASNWGPINNAVSGQGGGGSTFFGSGEGGYGRAVQSSSAIGYDRFYGGGGVGIVGDSSTWRSTTPELDGSGSFGYSLGNIASEVVGAKSSEDYIGSYTVAANRQPNRGIAA